MMGQGLDFVYYKVMDYEGFTYGSSYDLESANDYAASLAKKYGWSFHVEKREVKPNKTIEQLSLF